MPPGLDHEYAEEEKRFINFNNHSLLVILNWNCLFY